MGTTPTYSWPYPEPTDPVANGAQDIEDLALAVETTVSGLPAGKIVQLVRATDTTNRTTTSTALVDANLSVTITPTAATSTVFLIATAGVQPANNDGCYLAITDSSNTAISGGERYSSQDLAGTSQIFYVTAIAYDSPATTSATTYKLRFRSALGGTATLQNVTTTAQMFALEISA